MVVDRLTGLSETTANIEVANLLNAGGDPVPGTTLARFVDRDAADDGGHTLVRLTDAELSAEPTPSQGTLMLDARPLSLYRRFLR